MRMYERSERYDSLEREIWIQAQAGERGAATTAPKYCAWKATITRASAFFHFYILSISLSEVIPIDNTLYSHDC
jgi:hypothetical protein